MRAGDHLAGRYRLDARLGRGGMGEVWQGYDIQLSRAVAVKVLLEFDAPDELLRRFRREATIGARLQHPGITVVHDIGHHDDRLFIVMELLRGADLAALLARSPGGLEASRAVGLARQAADALAAAHTQQVVHRDLKPGNLFVLADGRLKICDFGLARATGVTEGLTLTGRPFGTPSYMAPEQWRGEHVDARCDLYALGCVLYAVMTGAPPFPAAEGPWALMRRHLEETPPSLRSVRDDVPHEIDRLVASLLAKSPADRPSITEVIAVLAVAGDGDGPRTLGESVTEGTGTLAFVAVGEPETTDGGTTIATTQPAQRPPVQGEALVVLPALGDWVTEGTVTRWLKQQGQRIVTGEPLLEVSTDMIDVEIPSPATGTLTSIAVAEDETVEIGTTLATIDTATALETGYVTPVVKMLAERHGVNLALVRGTGLHGRIRKQDVLDAVQTKPREVPVVLPSLGDGVTAGTVTRWLKQEGQRIVMGEPLVEVSTDMIDVEIPSPATGTLTSIAVAEDETVEIGTTLATISTAQLAQQH